MRGLDKAAMEIVKGNLPRYAGSGVWLVESRTQANVVYRVDLVTQQCNCKNGKSCWHLAAANVCEEVRSAPPVELPALPDGNTYTTLDAMLQADALASLDDFDWDTLARAQ